ncbi:hypothetical protein EOS_17945 [Caballeronia mineralivorans PML1(12)]|uniref:Uncharacterized protein n=1 Tax=Caballeronia mineralivorans PML1(12) TaxID=908627 RepID=A0A0J1FY54_9BURK|nr:hypothetical protein [Caballeronia mineralivorans]KLU24878.1 hypothetical protein EOS_17945 [Caballeronia mineralivorans PML1(12)]
MSKGTMLLRWLNGRLTGHSKSPRRATSAAGGYNGSYRDGLAVTPLQWRAPWQAWQLLSWVTATLLAPPFCVIGILLMINMHSDKPIFWASAMAIVAFTNAVAIITTNQRHHRQPFIRRTRLAMHYFRVSMLTGCALFLLLVCSTGILQIIVELLGATGSASPATVTVWGGVVTAGFGVLSFAHASVLHAWFAFEDPDLR